MFLNTRKWLLQRIVDAVLIYQGCFWGALFGVAFNFVLEWLFLREVIAIRNAIITGWAGSVTTAEPLLTMWIFSGATLGACLNLIYGRAFKSNRSKTKTPR